MKCYTCSGGFVAGIEVRKDEKLGNIVFLGEGRGRRYKKVGLLSKDPAEIVDGRVVEAHPAKITINRGAKNEKSFYVLAKPKNGNDRRVLVRVNPCTGYVHGDYGGWAKLRGNPEVLVRAQATFDAAGRIGPWGDDLVIMSPGDILAVNGLRVRGWCSGQWAIDYTDATPVLAMVRQDREWEEKQALDNAEDVQWV